MHQCVGTNMVQDLAAVDCIVQGLIFVAAKLANAKRKREVWRYLC
jgi:hypothetical protein